MIGRLFSDVELGYLPTPTAAANKKQGGDFAHYDILIIRYIL